MRKSFRISLFCLSACLLGCGGQNPDNPPLHPPDDPHIGLAPFFDKVNRFPDSVKLYEQLIDTLANRGLFLEAAGWCDSAQKRAKSPSVGWLLAKGDLYRMGRQYDSAISAYKSYLQIFPDDEQILLNLANAYAEKGDSNALITANRIASMYAEKDTRSKTAFIAGVYYNIAQQYPKARMWFDSAISLRYHFTEAWMERGYSFYDEKNWSEAEKNFMQLAQIDKSNAEAWYWLAKSNEASGNTRQALANYSRAYSLDRNLVDARRAVERLRSK